MEILTTLRCLGNIPPTFFSKLLNITVHTYIAYEQGKMSPSPEIIKMIAMLYDIDETVIYNCCIDEALILELNRLANMETKDKYKLLSLRILGDDSIPNYRNIRKMRCQRHLIFS